MEPWPDQKEHARVSLDHKCCKDLLVMMARDWKSPRGEAKIPPKFKSHLNHGNVKNDCKNLLKDNSGGEEDSCLRDPSEPRIRPRNDTEAGRESVRMRQW